MVLLLGHGYVAAVISDFVKTSDETVQVGSKVEVQFQLTPRDNPTTTYINTEQFTQGQHIIPPGIEQRLIGMHPGEIKPFPLSAEEGWPLTMRQKFKSSRQPICRSKPGKVTRLMMTRAGLPES